MLNILPEVVRETADRLGRLDILVNNAAVQFPHDSFAILFKNKALNYRSSMKEEVKNLPKEFYEKSAGTR